MNYDWHTNWVDLYAILEISRDATEDEIRKAHRMKAKQYHPDNYRTDLNLSEEEYRQKFDEIEFAFCVLKNEEEKNIYDSIYDAKQNGTDMNPNEFVEEEIDYDEVMNDYDEVSKKMAEQLSVKQIVLEELEKSNLFFEKKDEMILELYTKKTEEQTFYFHLKEFMQLVYSYIRDLNELTFVCLEYNLYEEINMIDQTIEKLNQEFCHFPKNENEAFAFIQKEILEKDMKAKYHELEQRCCLLIQDMNDFLIKCYEGKITPLEFSSEKHLLILEVQRQMSFFKKLKTICKEIQKEEFLFSFSSFFAKLELRIKILPKNYEEARNQGKNLKRINDFENVKVQMNEKIQKVRRIIDLIHKYPKSGLCEYLYQMGIEITNEIDILKQKSVSIKPVELESWLQNIEVLNEEAKKRYQNANLLNQKIDDFYDKNLCEFLLKAYEITLCKNKVPAMDKCEAIEMEGEILELVNLYLLFSDSDMELPNVDLSKLRQNLDDFMIQRKMNLNKNDPFFNHNINIQSFSDCYSSDIIKELEKLEKKLRLEYFKIALTILPMFLIPFSILSGNIKSHYIAWFFLFLIICSKNSQYNNQLNMLKRKHEKITKKLTLKL